MKRFIALVLLIFMIGAMLVACSKPAPQPKQTTTAISNPVSTTAPTGRIYYDKYSNEYDSLEAMPFYDENDYKYYLKDQQNQLFYDEAGIEVDGKYCFVNSNGVFINDKYNQITLSEDGMYATGKDGKTYYPAATVRWTNDGVMVDFFGLGKEITPEE